MTRLRRLAAASAPLVLGQGLLADPAAAHGISGRASLPVPAWLFAWAAAIVLVVSFIALSALWSTPRLQEVGLRRVGRIPILAVPLCGAIGIFLFGVVIWAGYEGVDSCALAIYRSPADAVRSQYWTLAVMVAFTCLGLWLLSAVNT